MSESLRSSEPFFVAETLFEDDEKSIALIRLRGLNARFISRSATTYEVVCGSGTMEVDGTFHDLHEGVVVHVPAHTPYQDEGELLMRATSVPPFDPASVAYI